MDDVLSKPYTPEDCEQLLRRWISNKASPAPARSDGGAEPTAAAEPGEDSGSGAGEARAIAPAEDLSKLDKATVVQLRGVAAPGRRTDLYTRLSELFRTGSSTALGELQSALHGGDLTAARATCHKLKSSAANVGAMAFSEDVRRLEKLCAAGDSAGAWSALERLRAAHPALISELTALERKESA